MGGRPRGKAQAIFLNNSRIQKEQIQLMKIEAELEKILGTVNEAINELQVEELQLKADAAAALAENYSPLNGDYASEEPSTSATAILSLTQLPQNKEDNEQTDAVINRQIIDLDMAIRAHNVEEEEDDV